MTDSDPEILVAGEALIDFLPDGPGPLSAVENFSRRAGGAPANVAVALARLDAVPWFWTRVGEDPFGDHLAATLSSFGLPDRFVERDPDAETALAFVSHDADADRAFTFYRDGTADTRVEPGSVPDETLDAASWVYVGGVMLAADPGRTATLDLAERATERDCTVVFDPNARPELWDSDERFAAQVREMLTHADVVKATPEDLDAAGFAGESPEALAEGVTGEGPHTVLLTLGESGAFARSTDAAPWGAGAASHGGYEVESVEDTTGAGDAFTAGALAAFAGGAGDPAEISLSDVLSFANAVAAVTTTAPGAMTALPTREQVRRFRE
ncbi:carbohydrate kinase [Halorussus gelatinilyticus]|uniref:Carbohydrate kinase n=1 Tax=Halorussus gelatinilyticus TaxID=2937524 RepID=A0A8U0IGA2_9EURY|nr:carbohydrate kinase [Halorussus gelatinilyticus]UPV99764.1 carbohydrate kinase [Halorussus gelatinilyticus]